MDVHSSPLLCCGTSTAGRTLGFAHLACRREVAPRPCHLKVGPAFHGVRGVRFGGASRPLRMHASDSESSSSTALLLAGVAPQQLRHTSHATGHVSNTPSSPRSQRTASAAAAASASTSSIPFTQSRSLFVPGLVLGALLMLAAQRVWLWAQSLEWAQQIMDAMDLRRSSGADATISDGMRMLPSRTRGRSPSRSPSPSTTTTITVPDSPETRDMFNSLAESLSSASSSSSTTQGEGESVEWVNMCWRKVWRVYQRGLERWITDLLQPVFDGVVKDGSVPQFVQRLRIVEFTLDHEAPLFTNMRRRYSRKDSDLTGVVDLRYSGGARMLLMLEVGGGRWRFKIPVLVSDLDIDCQMWIKIRLAPMCPWIGSLSVAFVGPPNVKVQLSPYNRVRLMRVPVVQNFLRKLLTVDLPGLMVLPKRLEVAIPPSVTSVAEAAVGRDTIMRAVASAVLQADAVEQALLAALPLGPQTPAGGVTLPEAFLGEFDVVLREARDLPVWGFPGQSNPYVRMSLGEQAVQSRRDDDTSSPGRHRHPVWNQEFQFLVEDPTKQTLEIQVRDSHLTGRVEVGSTKLPLKNVPLNGERVAIWLPLTPPPAYASRVAAGGRDTHGEVLLEVAYKAFDEEYDDKDSGYREAEIFQSAALQTQQAAAHEGEEKITDIRSAAAASSRAAVAASAALSAIAMTKAAAARAAMRAARAAQDAAASAASAAVAAAGLPKSVSPPPPQLPPPVAAAVQQATEAAAQAAAAGTATATEILPPSLTGQHRPPSQADDITTIGADSDTEDSFGLLSATVSRNGNGNGVNGNGFKGAQDSRHSNGVSPGHDPDAPGYDRLSHHYHTEHTAGYPVREHVAALPGRGSRAGSSPTQASAAAPQAATQAATSVLVVEPVPPGVGQGHPEPVSGAGGGSDSSQQAVISSQVVSRSGSTVTTAASVVETQTVSQTEELARTGVVSGAEQGPTVRDVPSQPDITTTLAATRQTASDAAGLQLHSSQPLQESDVSSQIAGAQDGMQTSQAQEQLSAAAATGADAGKEAQGPQQQAQQQQQQQDSQNSESWLGPLIAAWSVLTSPQPPKPEAQAPESQSEHAADSEPQQQQGIKKPWWAFWESVDVSGPESATSSSAGSVDEAASLEQSGKDSKQKSKPWWAFWDSGTASKDAVSVAKDGQDIQTVAKDVSEQRKEGKPWWKFWDQGGDKDASPEAGSKGTTDDQGSKPVEAIIIPPDLPLEEIAKEVARLKDENWRSKEERMENLWAKAAQRNDRPWIILCAALLAVACVLLTLDIAHWEQVMKMATGESSGPTPSEAPLPLATLQLLLQLLKP